jgi:AcrR family transcriptional regulator
MGRAKAFDQNQIAQAALAVVDRDGLVGLTMRAVADQLGTGPMTLYNYVASREELEVLVVDAAFAGMRIPNGSTDWRSSVLSIGKAMGKVVRAHPDIVPLILTRRSASPQVLRPAEALLEALAASGASGPKLLASFRAVVAVIAGVIQADLAGPMSRRRGEVDADVLDRFAALEAHEYPRLIQLAGIARTSSVEREIRDALTIVIAGIDASLGT